MKAYTFSEARETFATVLEEAERDGCRNPEARRRYIPIIARTQV